MSFGDKDKVIVHGKPASSGWQSPRSLKNASEDAPGKSRRPVS